MKPTDTPVAFSNQEVAPLAGAWIETSLHRITSALGLVAPLAGAWIETGYPSNAPAWQDLVAPLAGAWIAINENYRGKSRFTCLSPRKNMKKMID